MNYRSLSFWTLLLISLILIAKPVLFGVPDNLISWDTFGYYLYLPEAFIEGDLRLNDLNHIMELYETHQPSSFIYQIHGVENGNHVIQYSSGVAVLSLPFFGIGHFFAWLLDYPMNGFSTPYLWSFLAGSYAYMLLGIIFFRKILLHFFSESLAAILLILIYLGTNYFELQISSPCLTHVYLFALYVMVLWGTIQWYKNHEMKHASLIGFAVGLIIITRPLDGLVLLIPVLWEISTFKGIKQRFKLFSQYKGQLLLVILICFLVCTIQLAYWKFVTGSFLFNSYANPEEGLYIDDPHLFEFLFSFRKGWFVYTPIMFLMIFGFFVKIPNKEKWFIPIAIYAVLAIYLSASWSTWWYGYSFSQRTMMQAYPLFVLPLGALIKASQRFNWSTYLIGAVLTFFTLLNLFQTYQFQHDILHGSRMTAAAYWSIFGEIDAENVDKNLLMIDRDDPKYIPEIHEKYATFEQNPAGDKIYEANAANPYTETLIFNYDESSDQEYAWYLIEFDVKIPETIATNDFTLTSRFTRKSRTYGACYFHPATHKNYKENVWFHADIMYLTPSVRGTTDRFECFFYNATIESIYVKNLKVTSFVERN